MKYESLAKLSLCSIIIYVISSVEIYLLSFNRYGIKGDEMASAQSSNIHKVASRSVCLLCSTVLLWIVPSRLKNISKKFYGQVHFRFHVSLGTLTLHVPTQLVGAVFTTRVNSP